MTDVDAIFHDDGNFRVNAWAGEAVIAPRDAAFEGWGTSGKRARPPADLAPAETAPGDWRNPAIGWGIVLPESDAPPRDKSQALDAPECVRKLLTDRGNAPVFRYVSTLPLGMLRRYAADGTVSEPGLAGLRGNGPNAVPRFLLIIGSPAEIPWSVQCRLQLDACVGRLDLPAAGLENYITALLTNWSGSAVQRTKPVVWAVDHGPDDITRLMRRTIADQLVKAFKADSEFSMDGGTLVDDSSTGHALFDALEARRPAFIVTSSHGVTHPLDDSAAMAAALGLPMDRDRVPLSLGTLANIDATHGAIWYAHACCSAGCNSVSSFTGVAAATSKLGQTLSALTLLGARTAPLPQLLLGAASPARAFIGHVEPTFDWTLRDTRNGQVTTSNIVDAFYNQLQRTSRPPIGLAMQSYYRSVGGLWRDADNARKAIDLFAPGAADELRRLRLIACDLESMVLLGDPTVTLA